MKICANAHPVVTRGSNYPRLLEIAIRADYGDLFQWGVFKVNTVVLCGGPAPDIGNSKFKG
jgi:hypothetical protein